MTYKHPVSPIGSEQRQAFLKNRSETGKRLQEIGKAILEYRKINNGDNPMTLDILVNKGSINKQAIKSPMISKDFMYRPDSGGRGKDYIIAWEDPENYGGVASVVLYHDGRIGYETDQSIINQLKARRFLYKNSSPRKQR